MNYPRHRAEGGGQLLLTPNTSRHELDLFFFHRELMNVQKNLDPTVLFPCAESEGETVKDEEGGKGWAHNSFFCILWECCLKAEEEACVMCVCASV